MRGCTQSASGSIRRLEVCEVAGLHSLLIMLSVSVTRSRYVIVELFTISEDGMIVEMQHFGVQSTSLVESSLFLSWSKLPQGSSAYSSRKSYMRMLMLRKNFAVGGIQSSRSPAKLARMRTEWDIYNICLQWHDHCVAHILCP